MEIVIKQLIILYVFLLLGWCFGKKKPQLRSHNGMLSFLLVYLFLPSKVFLSFSTNFTVAYLSSRWQSLLLSCGILLALHLTSMVLPRLLRQEGYARRVYEYSLTISNYAYLGYTLVEGIYGATALTDMLLFCIPFAMYTNTVGYMKLSGDRVSLRRLANPLTCAIALGIFFGLTGIRLPDFVGKIFSSASACTGPMSMLLTGFVLSGFSGKDFLGNAADYVLIALRLAGIPLVLFFLCKLLGMEAFLPPVILMAAMPTGLNTIIFAQNSGNCPNLGARLAFWSHLLSCVTLPFWLSLLQ